MRKRNIVFVLGALLSVLAPQAARAESGIEVGVQSGAADGRTGDASIVAGYYAVGRNPSENGRYYGLSQVQLGYSGQRSGALPALSLESRGMGGWQIIKAGKTFPYMLHLGIEPTNVMLQTHTGLYDDVKSRSEQAVNDVIKDVNGGTDILKGIPKVDRRHLAYYLPAISVGADMRLSDACRLLPLLVRGGPAAGGQLRQDGEAGGAMLFGAYGAGSYLNCKGVNAGVEWTRILEKDAPIDVYNADLMVKPFDKVPLAVGATLGSTVVHSDEPKNLPAIPVVTGDAETHVKGTLKVVF